MKKSGYFVSFFTSMVILLLFFALGCTKEVRYSPAEISKFPPEIQKVIREGNVAMGMTPEQVRYSLGAPSEINVLKPTPEGKLREEWIYKELGVQTKLGFTEGRLTEFDTSGMGAAPGIKLVTPEEKRP
jgi:hypothetical protein